MNTSSLNLNLELVGAKSKTGANSYWQAKAGIDKWQKGVGWTEAIPVWGETTDAYTAWQKGNLAAQEKIKQTEDKIERLRNLADKNRNTVGSLQTKLDNFTARGNHLQAFANVSREDVNKMEYAAKVQRRKAAATAAAEREQRFYNLRAFNRGYEQNEIKRKIDELERIPHMTRVQREEWMTKKRTRKIYSEADIPVTLRGEQRRAWLRNKNKKQQLYLQGDSGYDTYVDRQRQLDKQLTVGNKYRY